MKIEVLKEDGTKIGYDKMDNASFDWHMRFAKALPLCSPPPHESINPLTRSTASFIAQALPA